MDKMTMPQTPNKEAAQNEPPAATDGGTAAAAVTVTSSLFAQGLLYGIVGVAQIGVDWLAFVALSYLGTVPAFANVLGRVAGAALGFVLNGRFTFREVGGPTRLHPRSLFRFAISWTVMTLLSTALVMTSVFAFGLQVTWIAKPIIDVLLAVGGFVTSRYWIYR